MDANLHVISGRTVSVQFSNTSADRGGGYFTISAGNDEMTIFCHTRKELQDFIDAINHAVDQATYTDMETAHGN